MSVTSRVTHDTTSNNDNDVSTSAVFDAVVNSPNLSQSNKSVCDQSIVDQSISDTFVNDKSVLTESTVCDDDKVNDNDDDDIKSPEEMLRNGIIRPSHGESIGLCFKG